MIEVKTFDWMPANMIVVTPCLISCPADLLEAIKAGSAQLIKVEQGEEVLAHSVIEEKQA